MSRYGINTSRVLVSDTLKRRYFSTILPVYIEPTDDDIYVIATEGDRLDKLAYQYYSDATQWWIIASANPTLPKDSLYLYPGVQLRIPNPDNITNILNTVALQNRTR